jgi:hypothetical protein
MASAGATVLEAVPGDTTVIEGIREGTEVGAGARD